MADDTNPLDQLDEQPQAEANPLDALDESPGPMPATAAAVDQVPDQTIPEVTVTGHRPAASWSDVLGSVLPTIGARIESKLAGLQEFKGKSEYADARKTFWQSMILPGAVREAKDAGIALTDHPDVVDNAKRLGIRPDVFARDWPEYVNMKPDDLAALQKEQVEKMREGQEQAQTGGGRRKLAAQVSADVRPAMGGDWTPKSIVFDSLTGVPDLLVGTAGTVAGGPVVGLAAMGSSIAPEEWSAAKNAGADDRTAATYATLSSLAQAAPEIPVLKIIEGGSTGRSVLRKLVGDTVAQSAVGKVAGTAATQGVSQALIQSLQEGVDAGILDEQTSLKDALSRIGRAGLIGTAMGVPLGGVHAVTGREPRAPGEPKPTVLNEPGTTEQPEPRAGANIQPAATQPTESAKAAPADTQEKTRAALEALQDKTISPAQMEHLEDQGLARRNDLGEPMILPAGRRALVAFQNQPQGEPGSARETQAEEKTPVKNPVSTGDELLDRIGNDEGLRAELERMKGETGWAEVGGRIIRTPGSDESKPDTITRTKWIPNAEWWPGRPKGLTEDQVHLAVDKALNGEELGKRERSMIEHMVGAADDRVAAGNEDFTRHLEEARADTESNPTEAQKKAGNYAKGEVQFAPGLTFTMENPKGSTRSGTGPEGPWERTMQHDYGYLNRSTGADGDHVDAFLTGKPDTGKAFVVNQVDPQTGRFDETKSVLGARTAAEARETYLANYPRGWKGLGSVAQLSTDAYRDWLRSGDHSKPLVPGAPGAPRETVLAGVPALAADEGTLSQPEKQALQRLRREGNQNLPEVADQLQRIHQRLGPEAFAANESGAEGQQRALRAGQRGVAAEAGPISEQAELPAGGAHGQETAGRRLGPGARAEEGHGLEVAPGGEERRGAARREDVERRKAVAAMSPEEMRQTLLTHELTGLPNRRAYDEAPKLSHQVAVDVDSLKWVNDTMGHEHGDELLKTVAAALKEQTGHAFHISGDEFVVQARSEQEAHDVMREVADALGGSRIEATHPDGRTVELAGLGLSYGVGRSLREADRNLSVHKADREARGERAARGEKPPGALERAGRGQRLEAESAVAEPRVETDRVREDQATYTAAQPVPAEGGNLSVGERARGSRDVQSGANLQLFTSDQAPAASRSITGTRVGLAETGRFSSGIKQVKRWQDAAHIFAPLRKSPQEHIMALVVDAKGRPLAVLRHQIGNQTGAGVVPHILIGAIGKVEGAAGVWFGHNHPSGVTEQSGADESITNQLHDYMRGSGIDPLGMVVVTPGGMKASFYHPAIHGGGGSEEGRTTAAARGKRTSVPVMERRFTRIPSGERAVLDSPDKAKEAVEKSGLKSGVMFLDNRHKLVATLPMDPKEMGPLRTGDTRSGIMHVLRAAEDANATSAITFGAEKDSAIISNLGNMLNQTGLRLLDTMLKGKDGAFFSLGSGLVSDRNFYAMRESPAGPFELPAEHRASIEQAVRASIRDSGMRAAPDFPHVEVHADYTTLPRDLRNQVIQDRAERTAGAVYDPETGHIHMIAENLGGPREATETLWHEAVGHHGLRLIMDADRYADVMDGVWNAMPDRVRQTADRNGLDVGQLAQRRLAAEEVIAYAAGRHLAGATIDKQVRPFWQRALTAVKAFVARLTGKPFTDDAAIASLIQESKRALEGGAGRLKALADHDLAITSRSPLDMRSAEEREQAEIARELKESGYDVQFGPEGVSIVEPGEDGSSFVHPAADPSGLPEAIQAPVARLNELNVQIREAYGDRWAERASLSRELPRYWKKPSQQTLGLQHGQGPGWYERIRSAVEYLHSNPVTKDLRKLINPTKLSEESKRTAVIARAALGNLAHQTFETQEALEQFSRQIDRLAPEEQLEMMDAIEHGVPQPNADLQPVADALRKQLDTWRDKVRGLGTGALDNFIENYFPHYWTQPGQAQRMVATIMGRRPLRGPASFLKMRTIPTIKEGMDAGLTPLTINPLVMTLLKVREMQRFVSGVKMMQSFKDAGLAQFLPATKPMPDGWAEIKDNIAKVRQWSEEEQGFIERGRYIMPEDAARLINNHVGRSVLTEFTPTHVLRLGGNLLNAMQLGFSAFHLGFTTLDASISKNALGLEQLIRGEVGRAAASFAQGMTPAGAVLNVRRGYQLLKAYADPSGATPEMAKIVSALEAAGGRVAMDRYYMAISGVSPFRGVGIRSLAGDVREALKGPEPIKGAARAVANFPAEYALSAYRELQGMVHTMPLLQVPFEVAGRLVRASTSWIMEHLVPMQKLGVFSDMAQDYLRRNPTATSDQVARAMQSAWDSVDNRLGEMVYDNVFWNRTFKDANHLAVRAVGWNLGTIREIGGAPIDALKAVDKLAREGKITADDIGHKIPYVVAMTMTTAMLGATINYMFTGQGPQELKDYFFPRTGGMTSHGTPQRLSLPSYVKDVYEYSQRPGTTIANKLNPIFSVLSDIWRNEDYFGNPISEPEASGLTQFGQRAAFAAREATPFSIQGRSHIEGSDTEGVSGAIKRTLPFIGVTPAPGYVTSPDQLERRERYEAEDKYSRELRYKLNRAMATHDQDAIKSLTDQYTQSRRRVKELQVELQKDKAKSAAARRQNVISMRQQGFPATAGLVASLPLEPDRAAREYFRSMA